VLVDPDARLLEVLRLESPGWTIVATHAGGGSVRVEPFQDIDLALDALWGDPEP
jgi:hypothetical protein